MSAENTIIPFIYDESPARVILDEAGEPWWIAKDICRILGISNYRDATSYLDDDEKGVGKTDTLGGAQEMATINESGLYTLLIRSNKPQARPFRRWVTHEVLPAIRKTGAYHAPASENPPELYVIIDKIITVLDRMVTALNNRESQRPALNKSRAKNIAGAPTYENLQAAWRMENIPQEIQDFILQYIYLKKNASTQLYEIWHAYKQYCALINLKPMGRNIFYATLHQAFAGYSRIKPKRSKLYISGIGLKKEEN